MHGVDGETLQALVGRRHRGFEQRCGGRHVTPGAVDPAALQQAAHGYLGVGALDAVEHRQRLGVPALQAERPGDLRLQHGRLGLGRFDLSGPQPLF